MGKRNFDIAIIGGGPAGSAAAIYLAGSGLNVCLFEKKIFPRDVLCGEFLSPEVFEELVKLGIDKEFLSLRPNKINSFRFINNDSSELFTNFPFDAYSIKRSVFDNFLLDQALKSVVKIFQPAEVKTILKEENSFKLKFIRSDNQVEEISTTFLIAAYGRQNILDKILGRGFINERSRLNGIKFHIEKKYLLSFIPDEIQIYASGGIYCGVNAVSDNEITLCFLEDRNEYTDSYRDHLAELMSNNKKFAEIFNSDFLSAINNKPVYGTGNIFFGRRELTKNGIFMIGDAAGVIAPLAGDGIGMALQSAGLLCEILTSGIKNKIGRDKLEKKYCYEWNKRFNKRLFSARIVQKTILGNNLRKAGVGLVKLFPGILPEIIRRTRG